MRPIWNESAYDMLTAEAGCMKDQQFLFPINPII